MKYIRKKINLENFTIRSIPKSVLVKNSEGKTVIDTENPKYYYGTIPNFKIDNEGNFILNQFGQKINNTINVNLFSEYFHLDTIGWEGKNFYWVDQNGVVLRSKQHITPNNKLRIDYLY